MDTRSIQNRKWSANAQALATVSRRTRYNGGILSLALKSMRIRGSHRDTCSTNWACSIWTRVLPTPRRIWVPCGRFYRKADNGLAMPWEGRVFMNPPFSDTARWLEKHSAHGNGISLVPATVESNAWRRFVWPKAKLILLTPGRMRFCNPDGSSTTGRPLRPIALIAWTEYDSEVLKRSQLAGIRLDAWELR